MSCAVVLEVMAEARQQRAVLVAELELEQSVLRRLEPRRGAERVAERGVLRRRERREHGPLVDELMLNLLHAIQNLDAARQLVLAQELDRRVDLVQDQLEPQLRDLVLDDEQQLVVLGRGADRLLRAQQLVELQVGLVADLAVRAGSRFRCRLLLIDLRARFSRHFLVILAGRATAPQNTITQSRTSMRSARLWPRVLIPSRYAATHSGHNSR